MLLVFLYSSDKIVNLDPGNRELEVMFLFIKIISYLILAPLLMLLCMQAVLAEDRVYQYRNSDGSTEFSDRKFFNKKLVKVTYYGRPTAKVSCRGVSKSAMKKRISSITPTINKYAWKHGIQPELVKAVINTESCFDHKAVSRVGAQGLMQLMPATAKELGVKDSFDPEENISGGIRYLRQMLDKFDNNLDLALAAYNAGPGAVKKYNGIPPFKETINYIARIKKYQKKS